MTWSPSSAHLALINAMFMIRHVQSERSSSELGKLRLSIMDRAEGSAEEASPEEAKARMDELNKALRRSFAGLFLQA